MKRILIVVAVVGAVVALIVFIFSSMKAVTAQAEAISNDVITRYVGLLESGQYSEAYDSCLAASFQETTTRVEFVSAHAAHAAEYGSLSGWEQTTYEHEANLFSSESLIGIRGVLSYANRDVFVLYKVDSNVMPYRIVEILGSPGASTTLSHGVW